MTQKEINLALSQAIVNIIKVLQQAGYVWNPIAPPDESKGHEHIKIAKNLFVLAKELKRLRKEIDPKADPE